MIYLEAALGLLGYALVLVLISFIARLFIDRMERKDQPIIDRYNEVSRYFVDEKGNLNLDLDWKHLRDTRITNPKSN